VNSKLIHVKRAQKNIHSSQYLSALLGLAVVALSACDSGGSGSRSGSIVSVPFASDNEASRFLSQTTFGATKKTLEQREH